MTKKTHITKLQLDQKRESLQINVDAPDLDVLLVDLQLQMGESVMLDVATNHPDGPTDPADWYPKGRTMFNRTVYFLAGRNGAYENFPDLTGNPQRVYNEIVLFKRSFNAVHWEKIILYRDGERFTIWIRKVVDEFVTELPQFIEYGFQGAHIYWKYEGDEDYTIAPYETLPGYTGGEIEMRMTATFIQWRNKGDKAWVDFKAYRFPHLGQRVIYLPDNKIYEYNTYENLDGTKSNRWEVDDQCDPLINGLTAMIEKSPVGRNKIYTYCTRDLMWKPYVGRTIWIRKVVDEFAEAFPESAPTGFRVIILRPDVDSDQDADQSDSDVDSDDDQDSDNDTPPTISERFLDGLEMVYNAIYEFNGRFWRIDEQCEPMITGLTAIIDYSPEGRNQAYTYHAHEDRWLHMFPRTIWIRRPVLIKSETFPEGFEGMRIIYTGETKEIELPIEIGIDLDADFESGFNAERNKIYEFNEGNWRLDGQTEPLRDGLTCILEFAELGRNRIHVYHSLQDEWIDYLQELTDLVHEAKFTGWIFPPVDRVTDGFPDNPTPGFRIINLVDRRIYTFNGGWELDWQTNPLVHGSVVLVWLLEPADSDSDTSDGDADQDETLERVLMVYDQEQNLWIPITGGASRGRTPEFRVSGDIFQWKYTDESQDAWRDIFEIPGDGEDSDCSCEDGLTPEFRIDSGWFQWKYITQGPEGWTNIFEVPQDGNPGQTPEIRVHEGWVQWKYTDEVIWNNLYEITAGDDGRTPELRVHSGWVQWKYTDQGELDWVNLFEVPSDGAPGEPGEPGTPGSPGEPGTPGSPGADGLSPEFRYHEGWIQWKYTVEGIEAWRNLYEPPTASDQDTDYTCSDGLTPEFRYQDGWVQWKYINETELDWRNLYEPPTSESACETTMSVTGDGTETTPIKLVNDEASPTASKYYGTNADGNKGYHELPAATDVPFDIYIDFLTEETFIYNCPYAMKINSVIYETANPVLDPVATTNMAQFDKLTITPLGIGLVILKGELL